MRELAALDLVEIRSGKGTFVRSLRPDLLLRPGGFHDAADLAVKLELLEVRRILEPEAAALAAHRATDVDLSRIAHDIACLREAVHAGYRPPEDLGFHLDVVRAAHNASLSRVVGAIVSFYELDEALPMERNVVEHLAVLAAIRARDQDAARREMCRHLTCRNGGRGRRHATAQSHQSSAPV
jgi:GntR family transcriptional repressor for pyruvate dehydrogenase complex